MWSCISDVSVEIEDERAKDADREEGEYAAGFDGVAGRDVVGGAAVVEATPPTGGGSSYVLEETMVAAALLLLLLLWILLLLAGYIDVDG